MKKIYFLLLSVVILFAACSEGGIPEVMTGDITDITSSSAKVKGAILDTKGLDIMEAGYCWGTMEMPTYETNDGIEKHASDSRGRLDEYVMTNLYAGEVYYVRAFAKNEEGVGYGIVKHFTVGVTLPGVDIAVAENITPTSVTLNGKVFSHNGHLVGKVGFILSTSPNVTEGADKYYAANYDQATGEFDVVIEGLVSNTNYYVRAFATNQSGFGSSTEDTPFTTNTFLNEFTNGIVNSNGIFISKYEITVGLWNELVNGTASGVEGLYPKVDISYNSMQTFINRINEKNVGIFDLPTIAQWRQAAGTGTYSGSENIDEVAWYKGNSNNKVHAVGTKNSNINGVYDMSGNVWEMTKDTDEHGNRIIVGGCWNSTADQCEINSTFTYASTSLGNVVGFRLIRE